MNLDENDIPIYDANAAKILLDGYATIAYRPYATIAYNYISADSVYAESALSTERHATRKQHPGPQLVWVNPKLRRIR